MPKRHTNDWMFNRMVLDTKKKATSGPGVARPPQARSWWVGLPRSQFWAEVRGEEGQRMARRAVPVLFDPTRKKLVR